MRQVCVCVCACVCVCMCACTRSWAQGCVCEDNYFHQLLACPLPTASLCRTQGLRAFNPGAGIPALRLPPRERRTLSVCAARLGQGGWGRPQAGERSNAARSRFRPPRPPRGWLGRGGGLWAQVGGGRCVPPPPLPRSGRRPSRARPRGFTLLPPGAARRPRFSVTRPPGARGTREDAARGHLPPAPRRPRRPEVRRAGRQAPPGLPRRSFLRGAPFPARQRAEGVVGPGAWPPGRPDPTLRSDKSPGDRAPGGNRLPPSAARQACPAASASKPRRAWERAPGVLRAQGQRARPPSGPTSGRRGRQRRGQGRERGGLEATRGRPIWPTLCPETRENAARKGNERETSTWAPQA